jgi:hypothetical protein
VGDVRPAPDKKKKRRADLGGEGLRCSAALRHAVDMPDLMNLKSIAYSMVIFVFEM